MLQDKTAKDNYYWKITLYRGLGLPEKAIEDYEDLINAKIEEGYYNTEDLTGWVKSDLGIKNLKKAKEILENL